MPVEPSPTPWAFPPADSVADDLVAVGADLAPGTLLAAYRQGLFPMALSELPGRMAWWSPDPRGVLPLERLRVSRSLRQSAAHFEVRVDSCFTEVVAGCADPSRDGGWIDDEIAAAYVELHRLGWAHSVEAWRDGELAGGLYGVAVGGLFAGESMFARVRDASKVALVGLVGLLRDAHAEERLLDTQWLTPHLGTLGVLEVPRSTYLRQLRRALELPLPGAFGGPGDGA
ncbi:leucyl/phenylalanyl-tRNA--protein transferase [Nocardioides scoriae]|uniref:Leucyl/phenylalanyl-tRNA--protein transferase n=1 Tax=Nocardioides scoriae TaxID=642780 RepID=A0A1H1UUJ4_9ACTN|nr:leucyl/phenylalanyl-tRNA--protein transferase [Nocardioides scoriae]SDS76143.1 leucyl/phenylalanyl-tRNA--protein transferase [Nocardioides scoriae]